MAALRYAARRILAGQASQSIHRAPFAGVQQRLFPKVIHGGSSTYPRRFSSMQSDEADPLTFEEKIKIFKRAANVMFRATKAISTIVACGIAIKLSVSELFYPGYLWSQATSILSRYHDEQNVFKNSHLKTEINSMNNEALLAAKLAELKSMLEDEDKRRREKLMEDEWNE